MKRLKKLIPLLTVILVAVMTFAFTSAKVEDDYLACDPEYVFVYNGTGSKYSTFNYTFVGTLEGNEQLDPFFNCPQSEVVCAIIVCEDYVFNPDTFPTLHEDGFFFISNGIYSAEFIQFDPYYDPNNYPSEWVIFLKEQ